MNKQSKITKLFSSLALAMLLVWQFAPAAALAEDPIIPSPPPAPTAPPSPPPAPTPPPVPSSVPTPPPAPTVPPVPTAPPSPPPAPTLPPSPSSFPQPSSLPGPGSTPIPPGGSTQSGTGGGSASGNTGSSSYIGTGDASSSLGIGNTANNNSSAMANGTSTGGAVLANESNGAGSTNTNSATITDNTTTNQENSARVVNDASQSAVTGDNKAIFNTGGDSTIITGDANVVGNIFNNLNNNMAGFLYAEFNVVGTHYGDLVIAFDPACLNGCVTPDGTIITNLSNGDNSQNTNTLDANSNSTTNQTNDANLVNNLDILADTGNNSASHNTNGNNTIVTGDANVNANIINLLNNNVEGGIIYSVVNVFGDLMGNIVLPMSVLQSFCGDCFNFSPTITNSGNGTNSTNTNTANLSSNDTTNQFNNADINNNITIEATTGDNNNSFGTGGDSTTVTGSSNVDASLLNVANNNIDGGDVWLVLVNNAGNWIGQIIGGPIGGLMAMSDQLDASLGADNSGNGDSSVNSNELTQQDSSTVNQTNNAVLDNNLNITANTGKNDTMFNTNGDSTIFTGDINVVANVVNILNNNIAGSGKLVITVINVFGDWAGDFFGPDQEYSPTLSYSNTNSTDNSLEQSGAKTTNQQPAVGGVSQDSFDSSDAAGVLGATDASGTAIYPDYQSLSAFSNIQNQQFGHTAENKLADSAIGDVFNVKPVSQGNKVVSINMAWVVTFITLGISYFGAGFAKNRLQTVKGE